MDDARARVRERWFEDDADERAVRLAQVRGDTDEEIQQVQRVIDIKKRERELEQQGVDPGTAHQRASDEADQDEAARKQGQFRDIIRGGFKAALDGNIGDWFQNWWKDRVAKGMEQALNSLSDLIARLFSKLGTGDGSSSGGLFGSIGNALSGLFGKKGSGGTFDAGQVGDDAAKSLAGLPGFATGGSFSVGGASGVDRNVVAMRLTKGEMVNVTRPGNDNGPNGQTVVHQTIQFSGGVDLATRTEVYRVADAARQAAIKGVAEAGRRRG